MKKKCEIFIVLFCLQFLFNSSYGQDTLFSRLLCINNLLNTLKQENLVTVDSSRPIFESTNRFLNAVDTSKLTDFLFVIYFKSLSQLYYLKSIETPKLKSTFADSAWIYFDKMKLRLNQINDKDTLLLLNRLCKIETQEPQFTMELEILKLESRLEEAKLPQDKKSIEDVLIDKKHVLVLLKQEDSLQNVRDTVRTGLTGMNKVFSFPKNLLPLASTYYEISDEKFKDVVYLKDVEKKIRKALENNSYTDIRYYLVSGGFAMATKMERINDDGTPKSQNRWKTVPLPLEDINILSYFKALFLGNPGHFRDFIFVISNQSISPATEIDKDRLLSIINSGPPTLPSDFSKIRFTEQYKCVVYVYEFTQENVSTPAIQVKDGINAKGHLEKANILNHL